MYNILKRRIYPNRRKRFREMLMKWNKLWLKLIFQTEYKSKLKNMKMNLIRCRFILLCKYYLRAVIFLTVRHIALGYKSSYFIRVLMKYLKQIFK